MNEKIKDAWNNAYYRGTCLYIAVVVTLIFGFQMYRYFWAAPANEIICPPEHSLSAMSLIPLIGVLFG